MSTHETGTELTAPGKNGPEVRPGSGEMFDRIARRYDMLNRVLSMGIDQRWRKRTVRALELGPHATVLDLATGTGDLAFGILAEHPDSRVIGIDPSRAMLDIAEQKAERRGLAERIDLRMGDAHAIPQGDASVDAVTIAFGLRNVPDRQLGLDEMARVVVPGGRIAILELGQPRGRVLGPLARFHIHKVVPQIGALLSGAREYRYLERSIAAFPPPDTVEDMIRSAGLEPVSTSPLTLGACYLFVARRPPC